MQFNKLYNLILLSIILEDINSKIKKAIDTLIKSGLLKDLNDPKALLVKTIIKRNSSIDINGKTKLDELLKQNLQYIKRELNKNIDLDSIPLFSLKKLYPNGVVIYRVLLSKAGQAAVRKIVDAQWGVDANPWCLIAKKDGKMDGAWIMWNNYVKWPKQIAFQDGLLIAFRASDDLEIDYWWNRKDKKSKKLRLKDRSLFQIPKPQWTPEELKKRQLDRIEAFKSKFTYNEKTGRYDIKDSVYIDDLLLINGDIPFPIGVINGNFILSDVDHLITSIKNLPTKVLGKFFFHKENELLSNSQLYKDCMKNMSKVFIKTNNLIHNLLTSKYDCDEDLIIDGDYLIDGHFPVPLGVIKGNFDCHFIKELKSLLNGPTKVNGDFDCHGCSNLKSLEGAPKYVGGNINISRCDITKLEYIPKIVNGNFNCSENFNLNSIKGCPEVVRGDFDCSYAKISSFLDGPKEIEGNIVCWFCDNLESLNGLPLKFKGIVNVSFCPKLKVTEEDKKKYKIKYGN